MKYKYLILLILMLTPKVYAAGDEGSRIFELQCVKCHTIGGGDRIGPDLKDVHKRRSKEWLIGFIQNPDNYLDKDKYAKKLLEKFNNVRMPKLNLTKPQAEKTLEYIITQSEKLKNAPVEIKQKAPMLNRELTEKTPERLQTPKSSTHRVSLIALLIFVALIILGIVLREFEFKKGYRISIFLAMCTLYLVFFAGDHKLIGNNQGYSPKQPIDFSHKLHSGELKISCFYCHYGAEKSPKAGIPPINVCMNCHKVVKGKLMSNNPSIGLLKLEEIWKKRNDENAPKLVWVKVHQLPDYVSFNHSVHINNNIKCQECHGRVEEMKQMRQESELTMGWCVNCHRNRDNRNSTHWKRYKGPTDCSACHH